jgi:hypothetical protein
MSKKKNKKHKRKALKPTIGDLHVNGTNGDSQWYVFEVVDVIEPVSENGKIFSWMVNAKNLRTNEIQLMQVGLAIFKSPLYEGRRDLAKL